jgi:hypothetical protein
MTTKNGQLKVWWIEKDDISEYFEMPVENICEAMLVIKTLTNYAKYQFKNGVRNNILRGAAGLMVFENDMWVEWEDITGKLIDEIMEES